MVMVDGRHLKQRTNEGLARVLVSPQLLLGLQISPFLVFHFKLDQAAVPHTQFCHCVPPSDHQDQVLYHMLQWMLRQDNYKLESTEQLIRPRPHIPHRHLLPQCGHQPPPQLQLLQVLVLRGHHSHLYQLLSQQDRHLSQEQCQHLLFPRIPSPLVSLMMIYPHQSMASQYQQSPTLRPVL